MRGTKHQVLMASRRVRAGLVCWPGTGTARPTIGAIRLLVPVAALSVSGSAVPGDSDGGCLPKASVADGHGMILIQTRVSIEDATYRVV